MAKSDRSQRYFTATFPGEAETLAAVRSLRRAGCPVVDVYTPYPVHSLDEALGLSPSRLPWVTFFAGVAGLSLTLGFQFYTNVFDWPLNVGSKPQNSTLAFFPITFELTILAGGVVTALAFFARSRLYPGARPSGLGEGATDGGFVVVVCEEDEPRARPALEAAGAIDLRKEERS